MTTFFSLCYAYLAPEYYKEEASLLPTSATSLSGLKEDLRRVLGGQGRQEPGQGELNNAANVTVVSPEEAFDLTNQYLTFEGVKRELINSPIVSKYVDSAFPRATEFKKLKELSKLMSVSLPDEKKKKNNTVVSMEWHDPDQVAEFVNVWVNTV